MMPNERLIATLSADLSPVRRRNMLGEAGLVLGLGAVELALSLMLGVMRPDMDHMGHSPFLMWRVGSLAVLAAIACAVALRSFSPTARSRQGMVVACTLAVTAMLMGGFVAPAGVSDDSLLDRLDPVRGAVCAGSIFILSLPILATLGALMHKAAPTRPGRSSLASGIAAGTVGALVFAFCCPLDDPLYVAVWYSIGCTAVAGASRWRLPRRFRL